MTHDTNELKLWFERNASQYTGEVKFNESLSKHTYYRIGGPAQLVLLPKSREDLTTLFRFKKNFGLHFFFLGMGSNLLVSDEGYPNIVIKTTKLNLEMAEVSQDPLTVRIGASVPISMVLRKSAQNGWDGFQYWTGIPGSVGGAIFMNAGTHLGETAAQVSEVEIFSFETGEFKVFKKEELSFKYRENLFLKKNELVTRADFKIDRKESALIQKELDETLARRKNTQPIDLPSCGSVFKNPKASGLNAWQVIDKVGLRGYRVGDAQISEKHSNFIVNHGNARAIEVKTLIELAKEKAKTELGIELEEEVRFLGKF